MAERVFHDPETGQLFYQAPGNEFVPVTEEQLSQIEQGGFESFIRTAGETLGETLRVPAMIGSAEGFRTQAPILEEQRQAQEARAIDAPAAVLGGHVAGYAADLALPVGVPGMDGASFLAGQAVRRAGRPFEGAIERGRSIVSGAAGRRPAAGAADDSLSAARTGPGAPAYEGRRSLTGYNTTEELDDLGIPLTAGDRAALGARNSEQFEAAKSIRAAEDLRASAELGSIGNIMDISGGIYRTKEAQRGALTSRLSAELGDPNIENITRESRRQIRADVQGVFKEYIDEGEGLLKAQAQAEQIANLVKAATGNAKTVGESWEREITSKIKNGALDRKAFSSLRRGLMDDMDSAFTAGNHELGSLLSGINERLDDILQQSLDASAQEALAEARRRWRILKALERRRVTDPAGELNARTFQAAYEAVTPGFKRAAREADDFETFLDTMVFLTTKTQPDSGTAQRIMSAITNASPRSLAAGAAGAAGYSFLSN